ncbi:MULTISPECIES: LysR family transcriptional regulator [Metabacillus]|jgi:DNA-binding transcriptional LysR family regulator|uniref:LysR family transcriptional regulator n=2 Tax=Metabacillus TaxID=2675233 RepID=A0A179SXS6_9BACI|nr:MULTISPECIES: LysR family transcriptional regulator [Metabacillus]OAS86626.1 LysR family transcriptional regulator [Metabacillus litoralis]QNF29301.1 LysR family transcriptional regulator [Metabacillus sp. KUDC1714]
MQTSELRMLVVLSEEMNMRKASERLFVSQPALSQRLQTIEKSWGFQIFIRSQKGLTLTPAGEKVISFAREVVNKEEMLREQISELEGEVHGTLKLAVASIIGQHWLPEVLKKYVNKYPHAKISLITGWSSEILKSMFEDHVHIGIIRGNPEWKGIKEHLLTDTLYLVDTEISKIEDVLHTERPFIQFKSDSTYYQEIQDWWHNQFQTSPKRTIVVDQIETCKQMAFNGIGYAILPSVTLKEDEQDVFKIPLLDENNKPIERDTWLLGIESSFELKQVKAFLDIVKEHK